VKYFFIPPLHRWALDPRDLPLFGAFVVCAALAHAVSIGRRRAEQSLREARAQLEIRVEERTAELRFTNASLRRNEAYLAEVQRVSHTGSWAWNVATRENVFWSKEMFRIYDFPPAPDAVSFQTARQRIHPEDRLRFDEALERAIRHRTDFEMAHRLLLPDGSVRYLQTLGHPFPGASGEPVEYLGTVVDVTERVRSEEALAEAQAQLAHISRMTTIAEMAASIAHEINQPLAAVVANGGAGLRWLAGDPNLPEVRGALHRIIRDGNRASDVLARIRGLTKKSLPEPTLLHLPDVLLEVVPLVRGEIVRRRVSLHTAVADDLPAVRGDRVQLQQVLLNLIMNAVEAMSAVTDRRRDLVLRARRHESGGVLVQVEDSGAGLDAQTKDRLFEAFFSNRREWGWGSPSAGRSSRLTAAGCGPPPTPGRARRSSSSCRRRRPGRDERTHRVRGR
jgi:C4-dicarboxylate-specific signal transduction histidine kinase